MTRYATLQTAAITLVRGLTRFAGHPEQVTASDDRILDAGISSAVIFFPDVVEAEEDEQTYSYRGYTMQLHLFVRADGADVDTWADLVALRDEIIELEEIYPHLNLSDALESTIQADAEPQFIYDTTSSGPAFLTQILRWTVYRLTPLSGGVFA